MQTAELLLKRCRKEGLKATPQRLAVFKALEGNKSHPSAEDVYKIIHKDFPTVSLTTIYRTLETLVKMGELAELQLVKGLRNYDPDTSGHHHIVCTVCGRVEDVFMSCPAGLELPEEIKRSFVVDDCRITFYGRCDRCQNLAQ